RQAMREFAFDLIQATACLYRLMLTRSVEVVRASGPIELGAEFAEMLREGVAAVGVEEPVELPETAPAPVAAILPTAGTPLITIPLDGVQAPVAEPVAVSTEPAINKATLRTTVLPIVSIDIERLMKASFSISEFGFLALKNPMLDETIRHILLKAEGGSSVDD